MSNDTVKILQFSPLCFKDSIVLHATSTSNSFSWNTGDTTASITVNQNGYFSVESKTGCSNKDSIYVFQVSVSILQENSFCEADTVKLHAIGNSTQYLWNTGDTTQTIFIDTAGIYWVQADTGSCALRDSIEVEAVAIEVEINADGSFCQQDVVTLTAVTDAKQVFWSTGETTKSINIATAGAYWVLAKSYACQASDTIDVPFGQKNDLTIVQDGKTCDEAIKLTALSNANNFLWNTGDTTQIITVTSSGKYSVEAFSGDCSASASVEINCDCLIWVPNTFSPNGDKINDEWKPVFSGCELKKYALTIYDRWGQAIFFTTDPNKTWDGCTKFNQPVSAGVYFYVLDYSLQNMAGEEHTQGSITVIR